MKKLTALVGLVACAAYAGERLLGIISVNGNTANTTLANVSASPDGGQNWWDGGYDMPFCIPAMDKITIQCDEGPVSVGTDLLTTSPQTGVEISAGVVFPTSVGSTKSKVNTNQAGTTSVQCARVAIAIIGDGGTHICSVFERTGRE